MMALSNPRRSVGALGLGSLLIALMVGCVPTSDSGSSGGGTDNPPPQARDRGPMPDPIVDAGIEDDTDGEVDEDCLPTGADVCNGLDDDCDGVADEGFGVGGACTSGEGICAVMGTWVCTDDGDVTCDAEPSEPAEAELCNDLDDDCDGSTDEDFSLGDNCTVSELSCTRRGVTECAEDGSGTVCGVEPIVVQEELCNDADDDCDGEVDEGIVLGELCEVGVGLCRRGGFTICGEGGEVICSGQPGEPRPEECNAIDDDCDGIPDEDFGGEPCSDGVGACLREGFRVCNDAGELECNVVAGEPSGEVCNEIDDDCDGTADEGYVELLGAPCGDGVGACRREGETVCDPEGGGGVAFEGIRQNVDEDELRAGGFVECWSGLYGENQPASPRSSRSATRASCCSAASRPTPRR